MLGETQGGHSRVKLKGGSNYMCHTPQFTQTLNFYKKSRLINSFSENYRFDFNNNSVNKFKKYTNFNLIGMGGSSLGAKAIYNFMKPKIKKKFTF